MGEVYRATDTKLDREVAIKVLPESFAQNKERLARFEREAKTLASLNHPNIASIYGLEQTGNSQALILELVEGEDLSERLNRAPMTVDEVMAICFQVAEALDAAHEKSIIHRDLKPANIKISCNEKVKVLDFGLAKALSDEADTSGIQYLEESPTITDAFTQPGTILGTAAYMSPEQARGKHVDKRTDIWAFGCVLYECLTGKKVFKGADVTETLASIIKSEPNWDALPEDTPANLQILIRKCLAKDRNKRLQYIDDARVDLEPYVMEHSSRVMVSSDNRLSTPAQTRSLNPYIAIGSVVILLVAGFILGWMQRKGVATGTDKQPLRRFSFSSGVDVEILREAGTAIQFSPNGKLLGFISRPKEEGDTSQIYLRRLDQLTANPIPGTEGADLFCFSPDGNQIAFRNQMDNEIQLIEVMGGTAAKVCNSKYPGGLDWGKDGNLYFAEEFGPIYQVSTSGNNLEAITELSENEKSHRWPSSISNGKGLLFSAGRARGAWNSAKIILKRFSDGNRSVFSNRGSHARVLPQGFLIYGNKDQILGTPISIDSLEFPKDAMAEPIIQNVSGAFGGVYHFDISSDGNLVYLGNEKTKTKFTLDWILRDGTLENLLKADTYGSFRLSPDGNAVAYSIDGDIWIYDIERRIATNLSFGKETGDIFPLWSPSGKSVFFTRFGKEGISLRWRRVDQSSEVKTLKPGNGAWFPWAFNAEGNKMICYIESSQGLGDQRLLELEGDDEIGWTVKETIDLITTSANDVDSCFSPDGKWLAYSSNESGAQQIYIKDASGTGARLPVSANKFGSRHPTWAKFKNELLFGTRIDAFQTPFSVNAEIPHQIYVAIFSDSDGTPTVSTPVPWPKAVSHGRFDIHPNGEKLIVRRKVANPENKFDQIKIFEGFLNHLLEQLNKNKSTINQN